MQNIPMKSLQSGGLHAVLAWSSKYLYYTLDACDHGLLLKFWNNGILELKVLEGFH